ncbi:hypothetical protein HK414_26415 [Ramlibacter terrae]|uniref:THIF-type NAD/FAD binding fold domain-containing protein n=1 Tax=Ramlibacter terrae TaxID=2732511 RepID=A0ABX6P791_9BURK|nr:hypothetical protein HK414_26415 [Ramlibacter terrae]
MNPNVRCELLGDDVAYADVADKLIDCDFIFLCADTMRARLVVNAIVNQHFVPAVQVGSKILPGKEGGKLEQFYSVVRHMRPGCGCLMCNGLISGYRLAIEEKSDEDWRAQNYGTESPNPSVIAERHRLQPCNPRLPDGLRGHRRQPSHGGLLHV